MRKTDHPSSAFELPVIPAGEEHPASVAIPSDALFRNCREITISHEGSIYRMRITRQGKLILYK